MKTIAVTPSADITAMLSGTMPEAAVMRFFEENEKNKITPEELAGAVKAVQNICTKIDLPTNVIDTCGTGGSGMKTINTSTLTAFIVAAAGGQVAKHGNRSASGNCGSFDLLERLGAKIDLTVDEEQRIFDRLGIVLLFARTHHPAMRHVAAARKSFGKPTIFNLIGPLANPAGVRHQMIGTPTAEKAMLIAKTLTLLGKESSLVVRGKDGLDEVTVCDTTEIFAVPTGTHSLFSPTEIDIALEAPQAIVGGTTEENTKIFRALASGEGTTAHQSLVLLNAAFALTLTPLAKTVAEGFALARETLASGKVKTLIEDYIRLTHEPS